MTKFELSSIKRKQDEEVSLFMSGGLGDDDDGAGEESEDEGDVLSDDVTHTRLLDDIMKMSKKKRIDAKREVRTSLGGGIAEVNTSHLIKRLGSSTLQKSASKLQILEKPVEKTLARKAQRAAGYEKVAIETQKWAPLVHRQRRKDTVTFPLQLPDLRPVEVEKAGERQRKPKTKLEEEVYTLLQGAQLLEKKVETEEELMAKRATSLQEVRERNRELWRMKELQRCYEHKAMLQNKSKSRKHHRLLRREKLKKQRAEVEELEKKDPEAALGLLEELEQVRVEERMSLRHKQSKWAHLQGPRATRDKQAMAALKENQRIHRELTEKMAKEEDSDEDETSAKKMMEMLKAREVAIEAGTYDPLNPWTNNLEQPQGKSSSGEQEGSYTEFVKFWKDFNERKEVEKKIQEEMEEEEKGEEGEEEDAGQEGEDAKSDEGGESKVVKKKGKQKKQPKVIQKKTEKNSTQTKQKKKKGKIQTQAAIKNNLEESIESPQAIDHPEEDAAASIDAMFDEAEEGIKKRLKRKLGSLGIKTSDEQPWHIVKKQKKNTMKKENISTKPVKVEEYDFTSTHSVENIDERSGPPVSDEGPKDGKNTLQIAAETLRKGNQDDGGSVGQAQGGKDSKKKVDVDPTKFLQVNTKKLITAMPDSVRGGGEEGLDDDEGERQEDDDEEDPETVIREAFADDYLIEEFKSEKAAAIKRDAPKTMSLALPGWGEWTGPNIKMSRRKLNKFRVRIPKVARKDQTIGNVIYNEKADVHDNLRKAMVSDLPYPFKSVKDFEASVRAPVGRMFIPEAAHKRMTQPSVCTKIGAVIYPMTEDELLQRKQSMIGAEKKNERGRGRGGKRGVGRDNHGPSRGGNSGGNRGNRGRNRGGNSGGNRGVSGRK